jgi:hypothetical protein
MSELSNLSPKEKAQTGMILIKTAIGEVLAENTDRWLRRNQIEDALGLWSEYGSGTYGAVASMFLDELVKEGEVVSRREPDGRTWLYRTAIATETSN